MIASINIGSFTAHAGVKGAAEQRSASETYNRFNQHWLDLL